MPSKITGNDARWKKAEITTPADCILFGQPELQALLSAGATLNQTLPFTKLEVLAPTYPATLKLTLKDGRSWDQTIEVKEPDPLMKFTTPAAWRQSELDSLRPLRDVCVAILLAHGADGIKLETP